MSPFAFRPRSVLRWLALLVPLVVAGGQVGLAQAPEPIEANMKKMLAATQSNAYDDFVAGGDAIFKAAMTRQMLEGVSQQLGPRLKQGYHAAFLGKLNQQGYTVYLWRLEFEDRKDDLLVKMAVKDGKVGGFWAQ